MLPLPVSEHLSSLSLLVSLLVLTSQIPAEEDPLAIVEVAEGVFLGSFSDALKLNGLLAAGITHIVEIHKQLDPPFPKVRELF